MIDSDALMKISDLSNEARLLTRQLEDVQYIKHLVQTSIQTGITVEVSVDGEDDQVTLGLPNRYSQDVLNILENAAKTNVQEAISWLKDTYKQAIEEGK